MGTFGSVLWGGGGSGSSPVVPAVPLGTGPGSIIYRALRIAGLLERAGRTPGNDKANDAFQIIRASLGSWNIMNLMVFTKTITAFPLNSGQKVYTIGGPGAGADFDVARPNGIGPVDLIWPTGPELRTSVYVMNDDEWAAVPVQDIPGAPVYQMYWDGGYPIGKIYLYFQPPSGYQLEMYLWTPVLTVSTATDQVSLPDGYEEALVYDTARQLAAMFPTEAHITPDAVEMGKRAMRRIQQKNTGAPRIGTDPQLSHDELIGGVRGWLDGSIR